jgi:hypothetical protein
MSPTIASLELNLVCSCHLREEEQAAQNGSPLSSPWGQLKVRLRRSSWQYVKLIAAELFSSAKVRLEPSTSNAAPSPEHDKALDGKSLCRIVAEENDGFA